jgi:hypothetical protein
MDDKIEQTVSVDLNGLELTYTLAPHDWFNIPVCPGDKMIDENGRDVFVVSAVGRLSADTFYDGICYDSDGNFRFTDECMHYTDRHKLASWCLAHPDDCGGFDRDRYLNDHQAYIEEWQNS